jgi:hypothetical protein
MPAFTKIECAICLENISDTKEKGLAVAHAGGGEKHPLHKRCVQELPIKDHGYRECPSCYKPIDFHSLYPFPINWLVGPMGSLKERIVSSYDPESHFGPEGAGTNLLMDLSPALQSRRAIISIVTAAIFGVGICYILSDTLS